MSKLSDYTDDDGSKGAAQQAYCNDLVSRVIVKSELKLNFLVSFKEDIEAGFYNAGDQCEAGVYRETSRNEIVSDIEVKSKSVL